MSAAMSSANRLHSMRFLASAALFAAAASGCYFGHDAEEEGLFGAADDFDDEYDSHPLSMSTVLQHAIHAGFSCSSRTALVTAGAIAYAESNLIPNAVGNNGVDCSSYDSRLSGWSYDLGLWQINRCWHSHLPGFSNWRDPTANASLAYAISKNGSDFTPWVTYKHGRGDHGRTSTYRRYWQGWDMATDAYSQICGGSSGGSGGGDWTGHYCASPGGTCGGNSPCWADCPSGSSCNWESGSFGRCVR